MVLLLLVNFLTQKMNRRLLLLWSLISPKNYGVSLGSCRTCVTLTGKSASSQNCRKGHRTEIIAAVPLSHHSQNPQKREAMQYTES